MKNKIKTLFSNNETILELASLVLTGVIMATIYSIFNGPIWQIILYGLLEMAIAVPFMLLCHFTNKHRKIGALICVLVFIALFAGISYASYFGYMETGVGFMQWLADDYEDGVAIDSVFYMLYLSIGGAAFFEVVNFYFVVARYRLGMLVVVSLIPCVVYAKAIADVKNGYVIALAGVNLVIAILRKRYEHAVSLTSDLEHLKKNKQGYILQGMAFVVAFATLILLIASVIPKENDAKYYDTFEDTFLGGDTSTELTGVSGNLGDYSGDAGNYDGLSNRRLYEVYGSEVTYLKRQNFDLYDFDRDRWTMSPEWAAAYYTQSIKNVEGQKLNLGTLRNALAKAEELSPGFAEKYGIEDLIFNQYFVDRYISLNIRSLNFSAAYLIAPTGTYQINPSDDAEVSVSLDDGYVLQEGRHDDNYQYEVLALGSLEKQHEWVNIGGADFTYEEAAELLDELIDILYETYRNENVDLLAVIETGLQFETELEKAMLYKEDMQENNENIPESIKKLALEITDGLDTEYEKALAIQNYFHDGKFIYDLSYRAPDDSPEYFLFESKRGTCSDYASAYVLLARAAGLSVRYAEGYVATEQSGRAHYYIKEKNSHAFPEVYIPMCGWMIFEPTSGIVENSEEGFWGNLFENLDIDYTLIRSIVMVIAAIALLWFVIRLLIPFIIEAVFIIMIRLGKKNAAAIYRRLTDIMSRKRMKRRTRKILSPDMQGISPKSMAPIELKEFFEKINCDISVITDKVEKDAYRPESDSKMSGQEKKEISKAYIRAIRNYVL